MRIKNYKRRRRRKDFVLDVVVSTKSLLTLRMNDLKATNYLFMLAIQWIIMRFKKELYYGLCGCMGNIFSAFCYLFKLLLKLFVVQLWFFWRKNWKSSRGLTRVWYAPFYGHKSDNRYTSFISLDIRTKSLVTD